MEGDGERFFIYVKFSYPPLLRIFHKYCSYINELYSQTDNPNFFELTADGYIIFAKDFESYKASRIQQKTIILEKSQQNQEIQDIFLTDLDFESNFPLRGIDFEIEVSPKYAEGLMDVLEKSYRGLDPGIVVKKDSNLSKLYINFPTYESVKKHLIAMGCMLAR